LPAIQAVISIVNSVFLQKFTQTYSKNFILFSSFGLVLNFNWSIVICLVIDYAGFGGSFYINLGEWL
jgi:hypothetical protein